MSDNRQVIVRCRPLIVRWYTQDSGEHMGNGGSGYCQCQDHIRQMSGRGAIRAVALVDIAMIGPAVVAVERDWGLAITPLEIMLLSAIVAAAFVAIEQLHQITLSEGTQ